MIMLICWRINEYEIFDIIEFLILLIQKSSAVFAIRSLLELGGDKCDNLNFYEF